MRTLIIALFVLLLLFGCTVNPQDTAPRLPPPSSNNTSAQGLHGLPGAILYTINSGSPDPADRPSGLYRHGPLTNKR